jgi:phosphatidylglycerophosphate synthase
MYFQKTKVYVSSKTVYKMISKHCRWIQEKLFYPLGKILYSYSISKDQITILSLVVATIASIFFAHKYIIFGCICYLIVGLLDILDGAIAKAMNSCTKFGALLDSTVDRCTEILIHVGIALGFPHLTIYVLFSLTGSFMVSYIRARSESLINLKCDVGIFERPERMLLLSCGFIAGAIIHTGIYVYVLLIIGAISYFTALQRILFSYSQLKSKGDG